MDVIERPQVKPQQAQPDETDEWGECEADQGGERERKLSCCGKHLTIENSTPKLYFCPVGIQRHRVMEKSMARPSTVRTGDSVKPSGQTVIGNGTRPTGGGTQSSTQPTGAGGSNTTGSGKK